MTNWIRNPEHERWHASRARHMDIRYSECGLPLDDMEAVPWSTRQDPPGRERCLECNDRVAPPQRRRRRSEAVRRGPLEVALRRFAAG